MQRAYPGRRRLAATITTQMDQLVEKALANGAEAAKVCGAGGGLHRVSLHTEDNRRWRALAAEEA